MLASCSTIQVHNDRHRHADTTGARTARDTRYPNELYGRSGRALIKNRHEIRDKSLPPSLSNRFQDETFAQFRVSRFTGDWHWPRSYRRRPCVHHFRSTRFPHEQDFQLYRIYGSGYARADRLCPVCSRSLDFISTSPRPRNGQMVRAPNRRSVYPTFTPLLRARTTLVLSLSAAADHRIGRMENSPSFSRAMNQQIMKKYREITKSKSSKGLNTLFIRSLKLIWRLKLFGFEGVWCC